MRRYFLRNITPRSNILTKISLAACFREYLIQRIAPPRAKYFRRLLPRSAKPCAARFTAGRQSWKYLIIIFKKGFLRAQNKRPYSNRCGNMPQLLGLFYYFGNPPILVFGELPGFNYSNRVANAALVVFVVRLELGGPGYRLFIQGVLLCWSPQRLPSYPSCRIRLSPLFPF